MKLLIKLTDLLQTAEILEFIDIIYYNEGGHSNKLVDNEQR